MSTGVVCTPHPSANFSQRKDGAAPDMVVLHYTAMQTTGEALERLCAPEFELSAHYLISETGEVFQLVAEDKRAWHAGAGRWGAVADVNSHSIGIELANPGDAPFSEPQMAALEPLLEQVIKRWAIPPARIIGHSDMAPGRKSDPGARFDWQRLALGGLSVWPEAGGKACTPAKAAFLTSLRAFGYTAEAAPEVLLAAFRLRFRPWASGALDGMDMAQVQNLAHRFPVDQTPVST